MSVMAKRDLSHYKVTSFLNSGDLKLKELLKMVKPTIIEIENGNEKKN
jgi:hypothetical protein